MPAWERTALNDDYYVLAPALPLPSVSLEMHRVSESDPSRSADVSRPTMREGEESVPESLEEVLVSQENPNAPPPPRVQLEPARSWVPRKDLPPPPPPSSLPSAQRRSADASLPTIGEETPVTNTDHMQAGEKDAATKTLSELEKDVDAQLAVLCEKVDHFKTTYGVMISGVPSNYATAGDISRLVNDADIAYKAFFGKDSLQLPFYQAMKTWKQTCDRYLKENESANRAKAVGSHHKRKACDIGDFDEDVAVIAKCLRSDVEKANVPSHGFSDSLDDYPAMPLLTSAHKAEIVAFGTIPQLQTMLKWSSRELTKSDEQDFTSQFSNKKLLQEIEKVELLVSPQLACKTDLTFLPSQSELKRSIFSFQLTTLSYPHFDINVTSFALPEVRLQVLEAYALFLFPVGRVEGDTISDRKDLQLQ